MSRFNLVVLMLACATLSWAQDTIYEDRFELTSDFAIWSSFGDDKKDLEKWISQNIQYPQEAIDKQEQGTVIVSFVVEKDGTLTSPEIQQGVSQSLDAEALRLVSIMPKWNSAYDYGVPLRSRNRMHVKFRLPQATQQPTKAQSLADADWVDPDGRKTYEGEFVLMGKKGIAKYQYKEVDSGTPSPYGEGFIGGTRMFDGNFVFDGDGLHAEGKFSGNRQVGTWHWRKGKAEKAVVFFNDNGELAGDFQFDWDGIQAKGNVAMETRSESVGHHNGKNYVREKKYNYISHIDVTAQYNVRYYGTLKFQASGGFYLQDRPAGTWKVMELQGSNYIKNNCNEDYNHEWTYANFANGTDAGYLRSWYFIDDSTGDKNPIMDRQSIENIIGTISSTVWSTLTSFTFRQTVTLHP